MKYLFFLPLISIAACTNVQTKHSSIEESQFEKALAGWWDEGRESEGLCGPGRSLHKHVFSSDYKQVTWEFDKPFHRKRQGDTVSSYGYDILDASSVVLTLSMQDEDRIIENGEPVLWVLVIVGPSIYKWVATHWGEIGIAPIIGVRCK